MKRTILAALATAAFGFTGVQAAQAHPVSCNPANSHYKDMATVAHLFFRPQNPTISCSTFGPRVFVFKKFTKCSTFFQTATVTQENKNKSGHVTSVRYAISTIRRDGYRRCR